MSPPQGVSGDPDERLDPRSALGVKGDENGEFQLGNRNPDAGCHGSSRNDHRIIGEVDRLTADAIRSYCLRKKGQITEGFPFGEDVLVFKVHGKVFLLLMLDAHPLTMNLKCDPELAIELRERYESVRPGYHMNKKHWNTITMDGSIPPAEIRKMIDHSYELIVRSLGKAVAKELLDSAR